MFTAICQRILEATSNVFRIWLSYTVMCKNLRQSSSFVSWGQHKKSIIFCGFHWTWNRLRQVVKKSSIWINDIFLIFRPWHVVWGHKSLWEISPENKTQRRVKCQLETTTFQFYKPLPEVILPKEEICLWRRVLGVFAGRFDEVVSHLNTLSQTCFIF